MASDTTNTNTNTKQPAASSPFNMPAKANAAAPLPSELLMAANRGDWRRLDDLMSKEGAALVPQVTIDIDIAVDIEDIDKDKQQQQHYGTSSDSVLHVVASGGDSIEFLKSSELIYDKAKHLLGASNAMGDTPFHCAARAGSIKMVSHLIDLARREDDDGTNSLQVALRKHNKQGETVLHEAIRRADKAMIGELMLADAELARFPHEGTSPLYLAILLGHDDIAEQLYQMAEVNQVSYSGPDGQNVMHVAVLRSERMTKKLLQWNMNLITQGDRTRGRTPLHFAASWGHVSRIENRVKLLLDADERSAYQCDYKGSFPIHVAALHGRNSAVVAALLEKCPDCAQLRDAQGRTFLHIAAFKNHSDLVRWTMITFKGASQVKRIMNMQDNEGNTALHLAATAGTCWTMQSFIWTKEVQLNLQNNKGQTALDLARSRTPPGLISGMDPIMWTHNLLLLAGGRSGVNLRGEKEKAPVRNAEEEKKKIMDSATMIGVISVLIVTVSFAAVFQLPGGYSTDGKRGGTPELAKKYSFQAFVMANNLAAFCSLMALMSLFYAGSTFIHIDTRVIAFTLSHYFLNSSGRCLVAAFAFGTHAVLAPVARAATILTWVLMGFTLIDIAWNWCWVDVNLCALINRMGIISACFRYVGSFVVNLLVLLWPYVVIGAFMAYLKVHGIH